jgi:hypothetical protein
METDQIDAVDRKLIPHFHNRLTERVRVSSEKNTKEMISNSALLQQSKKTSSVRPLNLGTDNKKKQAH